MSAPKGVYIGGDIKIINLSNLVAFISLLGLTGSCAFKSVNYQKRAYDYATGWAKINRAVLEQGGYTLAGSKGL